MPGPSFINGTTGVVVEKEDECIMDLAISHHDQSDFVYHHPRFLGCKRRHFFVHSLIFKRISNHYLQMSPGIFNGKTYANQRGITFQEVLNKGFTYSDKAGVDDTNGEAKMKVLVSSKENAINIQSIMLIKTSMLEYPFLTDLSTTNSTRLGIQIRPSPVEECVDMSSRYISESDIESLINLVEGDHDVNESEEACDGNLTRV